MKKLIAGNWKMNMTLDTAIALAKDITAQAGQAQADYLICPPFIYLDRIAAIVEGSAVNLGAQDCSFNDNGAHTGDISAAMIKDIGATYVILGHSERRTDHGETDDIVHQKAARAHEHELTTIICVGETNEQREQGVEQDVVAAQLKGALPSSVTSTNTVIAYEPVWAIGTGKTATPEDAGSMHSFIREQLGAQFDDPENVRILYGGSMKPENATALLSMPNIDGGLIGGASLKAKSFVRIGGCA